MDSPTSPMAMAPPSPPPPPPHLALLSSLTSTLLSRLPFSPKPVQVQPSAPVPVCAPSVTVPFLLPISNFSTAQAQSRSVAPGVRIEGLSSSNSKGGGGGGGPAFVGQVFTMLDPSGNGLMAVTRHLNLPFLNGRTPQWLKKLIADVTNNENEGPVFRFFMDLNDAASYVKELKIPAGMVGACRLDVAYENFREKPQMFRFVPNEKQVKAAKKLLKAVPHRGRRRKLHGVPVFTAQNLNIAIATNDGIRWYTPYFFDKSLLDNILEASIDQHFHTMIQNRHVQRRRDVIDDSITADIMEESGDSLFEPPEIQELMDEMGHSGIPLSVLSKAAELELLDVVDKVLLGNKWLRKATGIQPKFPYVVESFEERSAASYNKAVASTSANPSIGSNCFPDDNNSNKSSDKNESHLANRNTSQFPFGNWIPNLWRVKEEQVKMDDTSGKGKVMQNPLLPKITMVGISVGEGSAQMNKANIKKTMDSLTKELEQSSHQLEKSTEEKDPLFVANVGDYSRITRISSP
ncbi:Alpha-mannosidase 2 [Rhynchospora pubera]|uniref:Alpha-mannosidase 2 n=1 Tax=Rhynchospora pubera TaxID=906938 RepID=A0AAV8DA50_9POAL|nr:Alpha-mannosidase 2 [Rhynchospora pubera]